VIRRGLGSCAAVVSLLAGSGCGAQPDQDQPAVQAAAAVRVVAAFLSDFEAEQATHGHPMTPAEISALATRAHPGQLVVSFGVGSVDGPRTMSLRLLRQDCLALISPLADGEVERSLTCGGRVFPVGDDFRLR
jgi:hypothetical protein